MWHGYYVSERLNISEANWDALIALFDAMGTSGSPFPAYNNHKRTRLDGDAVIYESQFNPGEVSGAAFRQMLADEFGVDVEDITQVITSDDYVGLGTTVWTYSYNAIERFIVRRFGGGSTWRQSRLECLGYLAANSEAWNGEA
jgi:hypothetical protein